MQQVFHTALDKRQRVGYTLETMAVDLEKVDDMDVTELSNWLRRLLPLISLMGD